MLKSFYCWTHDIAAEQLPDVGECSYDQGGYFIINGSEKVGVSDPACEKFESWHADFSHAFNSLNSFSLRDYGRLGTGRLAFCACVPRFLTWC